MPGIIYDDLERLGFVKVLADYQEGGFAFEVWFRTHPISKVDDWYLYVSEENLSNTVTIEELANYLNDYLLWNLNAFLEIDEPWQDNWLKWCIDLVKDKSLLPKNDGILYSGFTILRDLVREN